MLKKSFHKIILLLVLSLVVMLKFIQNNTSSSNEVTDKQVNQIDAANTKDTLWYINHTLEAQQIVQNCHEDNVNDSQNCVNAEFATKLTRQ